MLIKDGIADSKNYENCCLGSMAASALEEDFQSGVITQDNCTECILTHVLK